MNDPLKGTNCLQKSLDGISILPDKVSVYELSAALFTAVTGETAIFLMFQKRLLLAENECAFSIIQSVVFVQINTKIHPHKPVLNNIIIYTSDSSLFLKQMV